MLFHRVKKNFLSAVIVSSFAIAAANCSANKTKKAIVNPIPVPTEDKQKEEDKNKNEVAMIEIGKVAVAEGDVLKDEDQQFSLSKLYSFKLSKASHLQIRKAESNGNCGKASAAFVIIKANELSTDKIYGAVNLDAKKDYESIPTEKFQDQVEAGDYQLIASITLDQECKDQLFYYNFVLEESTKP